MRTLGNFRFELNRAGVRELLLSDEVANMINETANQVLNRCPEGYGMITGKTSQRAKATVGTRGIKASIDNNKNNTLLKALGGGT